MRLLTARSRTRAELAGELSKRGYPDDIAAAALDRLATVGLINDADFADHWVQSRRIRTGKANRALAAELKIRGVDDDVIAAAIGDAGPGAERARAEELVEQKLRRELLNGGDDTKVMRRLVGMLARRGYSQNVAVAVVTEGLAAERERRRV